jgi:hypothetical protein
MNIRPVILILLGAISMATASTFDYSDSDLAFKLPGDWKKLEHSTPDKLVFRHATEMFQVTVSVMTYKSDTVQKKDFERILEHRITAEKRGLSPKDSVTQAEIKEIVGGYSAEFSGVENNSGRRFSGKLVMKSRRIVVAYLEGIKKSEEQVSTLKKVLFELLAIK